MWQVTYAIDSLDTQPDEAEFETEWEAIERVYSNIKHIYPTMDRKNFKAEKR